MDRKASLKRVILFLLCLAGNSVGQNAKEYVHHLCSRRFHGRGYYQNGHRKTAKWIAKQFRAKGLKPPPSSSYFQPFEFSCLYFTSAKLQLNGRKYRVGYEFLPHASISPISIHYEGEVIDVENGFPRKGHFKQKWIVFNEQVPSSEEGNIWKPLNKRIAHWIEQGVAGILIRTPKLTHRIATQIEYTIPIFYVLDTLCPPSIHIIEAKVKGKLKTIRSQNVCGWLAGTSDSVVILGAHYDHLGQIGKTIFRGANDNASGVALLLSLLDSLQEEEPKYSLLFIAFGAEEVGLIGSFHYVKFPLIPHSRVKWMFNFDLWGYGEEGTMMENGDQDTLLYHTFQKWSEEQFHGTFPIRIRKNAPNSDHFPFTLVNVPAFFFYALGGKPYYHDPYDAPDQVTLVGMPKMVSLILRLIRHDSPSF